MRQRYRREVCCNSPDERGPDCARAVVSTERNGRICRIAQMRWLQDFIIEVACYLKLRWDSKVTPRSFRVEEGRIAPANVY